MQVLQVPLVARSETAWRDREINSRGATIAEQAKLIHSLTAKVERLSRRAARASYYKRRLAELKAKKA